MDSSINLTGRNQNDSYPTFALYTNKKRAENQLFFYGSGERIRTLTNRVRGLQSFFKTAYLNHFSDFASLKNLSEFYFCSFQFVLRFWFELCLSKISVINAPNRTKMTLEFWILLSLLISQKLSQRFWGKEKVPEYCRKKQYSGIKKPRNTNVPR